jgi:hypothetical protein
MLESFKSVLTYLVVSSHLERWMIFDIDEILGLFVGGDLLEITLVIPTESLFLLLPQ